MSWFNEQISSRKKLDNQVFNESLDDIQAAVMGKKLYSALSDERVSKVAIEEVLKSLNIKCGEIEFNKEISVEKNYDCILKPYGVMRRRVRLARGWYKDAVGPMLTVLKAKPDVAVALIPGATSGYRYLDIDTGKYIKVDRNNEDLFDDYATCFYMPLPARELTISDLIHFILQRMSRHDVELFVALMAAITLIGLIVPKFNQWLFGTVLETKDYGMLSALTVFILCYIICNMCFTTYQELLNAKILTKQRIAVEAAVMGRMMTLPTSFFKEHTPGNLANRMSYVPMLCEVIVQNIGGVSLAPIFSLMYIIQIFTFAPSLASPALLIVVASTAVTVIMTVLQVKISRQVMEYSAELNGKSYGLIKGIQKIKLAGAEKRMFALWAGPYAKKTMLEFNPPMLLRLGPAIQIAVNLVGTIAIYFIAIKTNVSVANYFAFNAAYGMISAAFMSLSNVATSIASVKPMLDMIEPIMEAKPEFSDSKKTVTKLDGEIELSHLKFAYSPDMPNVIDDLSLKIDKGEFVAIVGTTGCGKSTLLRLLLGFETPQKGAIYYDGRDMQNLDLSSLRKNIGTVMQDGKLFLGDIYSNITISAPELTMQEAWEAAEIASIADEIREMPMQMQTLISEGQGGVSGGQKQRLLIARAVANRPKILIFDEATSALDNITQKKVVESIDSLKCTRIVIAHRLSTIQNADRILFMDQGRITEEGTYEELIKKGGQFAELVRRQRIDVDTD